MKKAKFTQGAWSWWDEKTKGDPRPKNYDLARLMSSTGTWIISTYGGAGVLALGKSEQQQANARLIAAAPDLYAAVESLMQAYGAQTDPRNGNSGECWDKARAAYAKARGEQVS